jgi:hypothetical protein
MRDRTIQELHVDSIALYARLEKVTEEEPLITYKELNAVVVGDTQKERRGCLNTARRMMQREYNILFAPVIGIGLKRMTDRDVVLSKDKHYQKVRRGTQKSIKDLSTIQDFNGLPNGEKTSHLATMSNFKMIQHFLRPKQVKRLEECVSHKQEQLSMVHTIEALTGKKVGMVEASI